MNKKVLLCLTAAAMLTACAQSSELPRRAADKYCLFTAASRP
ncbi:MAG: hypothetical protein PUI48_10120 [Oscillospiraceae bacterium]|nr:hypothetical protein [Oscillospiraceae bacterium]MDY6209393.1 hypothetical protein [Oscillospiraceae bacterium]